MRAKVYYGDLDSAVLGLVQRRIRVMAGTYHAEALAPLCRALAGLEVEISQALADVVTRLPLLEAENIKLMWALLTGEEFDT